MDVKGVGIYMFALCSVMVDISYAGQNKRVQVTDDDCNSTYTLNQNDHIVLTFKPEYPFGHDEDRYTFTRCVFTIINNSTSMPLCMKNRGGTYYATITTCSRILHYFIGYQYQPQFNMRNGYSCSDLERKPMCSSKSTVYVVFDNLPAFARYPVQIELYVKKWVVTTTSTARPSTTPYWYNDDDDVFDDGYEGISKVIMTAFGIGLVAVLCCVCCACMRNNESGSTGRTNQNAECYQQPQPDTHSPRMPTYTPDTYSPDMPTYTEEAPPYSEVMQQQRLYSYEANIRVNWQIHDPVHQEARANSATSFPIPENQPLCHDQPVTNYTSEEQTDNQTTPTAPPPDYSDLPPPPPYPGY